MYKRLTAISDNIITLPAVELMGEGARGPPVGLVSRLIKAKERVRKQMFERI